MKEWASPYNPFNSMKALVWREWFENFAKDNYLPPVSIDIDPSNKCNFKCIHCNAYDMICKSGNDLPVEHLINISNFSKEWGIKSACISGGGEPFMNKGTTELILQNEKNGIENGIITNGSLLNDYIIDVIANNTRWCGISVDAATSETFKKIKNIPNKKTFSKVISNIEKLSKQCEDTKCDVAYKYLLEPLNALEIYEAAKLAKSIGVNDFHLRPVGWDNITKTKNSSISFKDLLDPINEQIQKAMELESNTFHVYGIRHKFNDDFSRKVGFKRCRAIPLIITMCADGNVYLCFDRRGDKTQILCSHYPDVYNVLKYWNSKQHRQMMKAVKVEDCPRCTFHAYNEMVEQVFIKDKMCKMFP